MASVDKWYSPKISDKEKYACIPQYALLDDRLTHEQLKVLLALSCYADQGGACYPKRRRIANLTNISEAHVSRATTKLVEYGWLRKRQTPRTCRYWLMVPDCFRELGG
jgi:DNA-binding MarR family transcriptional regulator